jgi:hypothetical protein
MRLGETAILGRGWTIEAVSTVSQNACTETRGAGAMNSSGLAPATGCSAPPVFS